MDLDLAQQRVRDDVDDGMGRQVAQVEDHHAQHGLGLDPAAGDVGTAADLAERDAHRRARRHHR
ncbi:hypothetical protein ACFQV8_15290 [Pseudonocardia benzenivorans]